MHQGGAIGSVVRSKTGVKPLFVSVGHKIDLTCAVRAVLALHGGYRVPEPTRLAHIFVNELREKTSRNARARNRIVLTND
jgi:deoxyribonuclease V